METLHDSYPAAREALTAHYGRPSASPRPETVGGGFGRLARILLDRSVAGRKLEALLTSLAEAGLLDPPALVRRRPVRACPGCCHMPAPGWLPRSLPFFDGSLAGWSIAVAWRIWPTCRPVPPRRTSYPVRHRPRLRPTPCFSTPSTDPAYPLDRAHLPRPRPPRLDRLLGRLRRGPRPSRKPRPRRPPGPGRPRGLDGTNRLGLLPALGGEVRTMPAPPLLPTGGPSEPER